MQTLKVDVGHAIYPILIGPGLLGHRELFNSTLRAADVLIVTNTTVARLYLEKLQATLSGRRGNRKGWGTALLAPMPP